VIEGEAISEKGEVKTRYGLFHVSCEHQHQKGDIVHLLARPLPADAKRESNLIQGIVTDAIFQQDRFKITLDNRLYVFLPDAPKVGEKIRIPVKVECLG
jgi:hypothetical protein